MRLLNAECIIAPSAVLEETKKELDEYFAGKRHTFEIPLHPVGTDFQNKYGKPYLKFRMEKQELTKRLHKR